MDQTVKSVEMKKCASEYFADWIFNNLYPLHVLVSAFFSFYDIIAYPSQWPKSVRRVYVLTWPVSMPIRLAIQLPCFLIAITIFLFGAMLDSIAEWWNKMWNGKEI